MSTTLSFSYLLLTFLLAHQVKPLPLSTHGRWIIDAATNHRVKLRCVNWVGHMPAVIPEGLSKQPLHVIASLVPSLGFNCVRLTWATYLWTDDRRYETLTVEKSLKSLGLDETLRGVERNNPAMVGLGVREVYERVVRGLGEAGVMVVLDNHVSRPQWCCGREDGNGFFGDLYFDEDEWVRGLEIVARRFQGFPQVIGMSMRNELRGPNQTRPAWYRNVARGAQTIHKANPNVLVIVSGLSFDTDLSFLAQSPLTNNYGNKLVLEAHWYAFSEGKRQEWAEKPLAQVCSGSAERFDARAGFFTRRLNGTVPLFVSEFGGDQRGANRADNNFLSCFMAFAAERDLDWALWAFQGSYYWRSGVEGFVETYGVLDSGWARPKNPKFRERYRFIQEMIQGMANTLTRLVVSCNNVTLFCEFFVVDPRSSVGFYQIIYHPPTGQCLAHDRENNAVVLRDCEDRARWRYNGEGEPILLVSSATVCLRLVGVGQAVQVSEKCDDVQSFWRVGSGAGFGLIGGYANGTGLCMERDSANASLVLTRECVCRPGSACSDDPRHQWFKIISSNIV